MTLPHVARMIVAQYCNIVVIILQNYILSTYKFTFAYFSLNGIVFPDMCTYRG